MRLPRAFVSLTLPITILATLMEVRGGEVSSRENPLQEILGAWDKRRHEVNSVEWRFRGSTRWSKNSGAKSPDDTDMVEGKLEVVARFNFAENRLRREVEWDSYFGNSYGIEHQHTIAAVSRGRLTTRILPGSADLKTFGVQYVIRTGEPREMPSGDMDLLYWRPILWGSGVVVTRSQPVGAVSFPATNDSSAFTFEGWDALDGKQLALLSADLFQASLVLTNATNFVRYWVDVARDSAIVRAVAESGVLGQQMTGYEIDIEYGPHARTWLPTRWVARETLNGKVTMMQTVEATQTDVLTTDDPALYVLEPEPGSKVYAIETRRDPTTREILVSRKHYTTTAAGQNNVTSASLDRYGASPADRASNSKHPKRRGFLLVFMVASAVIFFLIAIRNWQNRRSESGTRD